jgi:hypothetical protein
VLIDPQLALEHLEVMHDLDGVLVRGGGDNTFGCAGQQLRSRRLRDGDELTVGTTRLLFEEPAQVAIDALKNEPDLPFSEISRSRTETEALPVEPEPAEPQLEAAAGPKPKAASERSDADMLIYALAAIVLIASTLGLLLLLRAH